MDFIWSVSTTVKTYKEYVTATTITKKMQQQGFLRLISLPSCSLSDKAVKHPGKQFFTPSTEASNAYACMKGLSERNSNATDNVCERID